jgi:two-component SAPR family response regulator
MPIGAPRERERLREVYLDVLGYLIDGYLDGNDYARAIDICRLGLVREPYREIFTAR